MTRAPTRAPAPAPPEWLRRVLLGVAGVGRRVADELVAVLLFGGLALIVTAGLWSTAATEANPRDHAQFLFFFEHAAHAVTHFDNPLFTPLMGAPNGVNLMANTAFLGMTLPLVPVTLIAGPEVAYGLSLTLSLAGTAIAWYVVVRRHVTPHRGIAFVAGALAGFSPGIVGHANAHPNFVAQFMLPLIISAVIRLRASTNPIRSGVPLGLMIAYQMPSPHRNHPVGGRGRSRVAECVERASKPPGGIDASQRDATRSRTSQTQTPSTYSPG